MFKITTFAFILSLLTACMHVQPVKSIAEAESYSTKERHLVEVSPKMLLNLLEDHSKLNKAFVVEFSADWCVACKRIKPILARIARTHSDKVTIGIFDATKYPDIKGVQYPNAWPTFLYFVPGHEVKRSQGAHEKLLRKVVANLPKLPQSFEFRDDSELVLANHFYIGGATDITKFGKEALMQKALFEEKGLSPSEGACYFNEPDLGQNEIDSKDFNYLQSSASDCFKATKKKILSDLKRSVKEDLRPLYIYISSHGNKPSSDDEVCNIAKNARISLGENSACRPSNFLVPQDFRDAFKDKAPDREVFLVLQACYSGGFIEPLKDIPGLTILTASRHDRTSFGCSSYADFTYFGGAFLRAASTKNTPPTQWDWSSFYEEVRGRVNKLESRKRIPENSRSLPQLFLSGEKLLSEEN